MVDFTPRINNACPFPPGISPPEKKASYINRTLMKYVKNLIYNRAFISRRAATALIFITVLMMILTFPWIKHNVIIPYFTPRFDGVIVYVDGYQGSWDGKISLSNDEIHNSVQTISGNYVEEYLLSRPTNSLGWNVTVTVRNWVWMKEPIGLRIVNGLSGEILSEGVTRFDNGFLVVTASAKV